MGSAQKGTRMVRIAAGLETSCSGQARSMYPGQSHWPTLKRVGQQLARLKAIKLQGWNTQVDAVCQAGAPLEPKIHRTRLFPQAFAGSLPVQ